MLMTLKQPSAERDSQLFFSIMFPSVFLLFSFRTITERPQTSCRFRFQVDEMHDFLIQTVLRSHGYVGVVGTEHLFDY